MPRDYAKSRPNSKGPATSRTARRSTPSGFPGWVWLLFGLSIGLVVAAVVYVVRPTHPAPPALPGPDAQPSAESRKQIPVPPKQASRFSFYEMLPSYEVVIPREDAAASAKTGKPTTSDIAAPGQYLIQVGAYHTREEADRGRASLALLGVESKIEQVTIDQSETWFRVRIGPENNLPKAQEILQRLDDNGIKGMLVKVKSDG